MKNRVIRVFAGMFLGFIAEILGFVLFWLWFTRNNHWDLVYFFKSIFLEMKNIQIGTFSILAAMVLFYFLNRKNKEYMARGVVISIIIAVIFLLYQMAG